MTNYLIYLFRVKTTGTVIYVGSTKQIGQRLNEHRRAFREKNHELPIHTYMKAHNLKLFKDVEVCIVDYLENVSREKALELEAEYYYKYKDTIQNTRPAEIRNGEFAPRSKPVKCLNDGKCFVSIREASEYYGINRVTIMSHLNKGTIIKSGLTFQYLDSNEPQVSTVYRIYCVEDNRYFSTIKSCAETYGITPSVLHQALRGGKEECFMQGKHFRRCNDYRKHSREAKKLVGYTQVSGNGETPRNGV